MRLRRPDWTLLFPAALVAVGLLGFTGSSWWAGARRSPLYPLEVRQTGHEIFGVSREVRSDEFDVDLPAQLAQQQSSPPYGEVNLNEGLGQLQRNPSTVPVLDWGLAFRPLSGLLFIRGTWATGVRWYLRAALLFLGLFAWLTQLLGERRRFAGPAALALFCSSAFSWWFSSGMIDSIFFATLTCACALRRARGGGLIWLLGTAWLSCCTFFLFYPPIWAPLLILIVPSVLDARRDVRGSIPILAAILAGPALSLFYYAPMISLLANTAYPARRVAAAGALPIGRLLDLVWPALTTVAPLGRDPALLGGDAPNVCEASAVEALPLFLALVLAAVSTSARAAMASALRRHRWLVLAWGLLAIWLLVPLPSLVTKLMFLQASPWKRVWPVFGLGCGAVGTLLLAELVSWRASTRQLLIASLLIVACFALACLRAPLSPEAPGHALTLLAALAGSLLGIALGDLRILFAAWWLPLLFATAGVNPVVPSRTLFLRSPAHAAIDEALRREPGRLLDFSTHTRGEELAGFGWPVLAAVQYAPDRGMFDFLAADSPGLTRELYDRYSRLAFIEPPAQTNLPAEDGLEIAISPCSPRLAALGVNHLLRFRRSFPPECAAEFEVRQVGYLELRSRRKPVCPLGVFRGAALPADALAFDYRCGNGASLKADRHGLEVALPDRAFYALAVNTQLLGSVRCDSGEARVLGAHLVFSGASRCRIDFLDSGEAALRLLRAATAH